MRGLLTMYGVGANNDKMCLNVLVGKNVLAAVWK